MWQRDGEGHCPAGRHCHPLQAVGRRVDDDREQVGPIVDAVSPEAGVAPHRLPQREVRVVDAAERVVGIVETPGVRRPVCHALQPQPVDEDRVRVLHVVRGPRAPLDVPAIGVPAS